MTGTVLAYHSSGEAAEDLYGSGTRAAIGISELIVGRPDALQHHCALLMIEYARALCTSKTRVCFV